MRITVLGKSPAWQDANGACSGYLVESHRTSLLLDCGNGVFSKLRRWRDYLNIDAVLITHMHADHFLDLIPFSYALTYAPRQQPVPVHRWSGTDSPARPLLYVPEGGRSMLRSLGRMWNSEELVENAFNLREYRPTEQIDNEAFQIRLCRVPHFLPANAVDIRERSSGSRMTYSSDCAPSDELVDFAKETDLLLIESTLPRPERDGLRGHLTPAEAGEHGRRAKAGRLVLTHISDELDELWVRSEAEKAFGQSVQIAAEGAVYDL